jgi:hypothetical protein
VRHLRITWGAPYRASAQLIKGWIQPIPAARGGSPTGSLAPQMEQDQVGVAAPPGLLVTQRPRLQRLPIGVR